MSSPIRQQRPGSCGSPTLAALRDPRQALFWMERRPPRSALPRSRVLSVGAGDARRAAVNAGSPRGARVLFGAFIGGPLAGVGATRLRRASGLEAWLRPQMTRPAAVGFC